MAQISQDGIDLITSFEGLRLTAYKDAVGIWTIGYGHTGRLDGYQSVAAAVEANGGPMTITESEAEDLLQQDLNEFERGVNNAVDAPATQSMFDAFVSLAFNIGVGAFRGSTAIKRHNAENYQGAAEAITWWNKAGGEVLAGLVRRRAAESALYLRDLDEFDSAAAESVANVEENAPRRNNPVTSRTTAGAATAGGAGAAGAGAVLMDDDEEASGVEMEPSDDESANDGVPEQPIDNETLDEDLGNTDPGSGEETSEGPTAPEETTESTEAPASDDASNEIPQRDATDAIIIAMGILAVLAAIYVISARIDDWRNYRR